MSIEGGREGLPLPVFIDSKVTMKLLGFVNSAQGQEIKTILERCKFALGSIEQFEIPKGMMAYYLAHAYFAHTAEKEIEELSLLYDLTGLEGVFVDFLEDGVLDADEYIKCSDEFQLGIHPENVSKLMRMSTVVAAGEVIRGVLLHQIRYMVNNAFKKILDLGGNGDNMLYMSRCFDYLDVVKALTLDGVADGYYSSSVGPQQNPVAYLQYFEPLLHNYILLSLINKMRCGDMGIAAEVDIACMLNQIDDALRSVRLHDLKEDEHGVLALIYRTQQYRALADRVRA